MIIVGQPLYTTKQCKNIYAHKKIHSIYNKNPYERGGLIKNIKTILFAFAISNMASLIYQISWIKNLSYIFGTSVYSIGVVLSCFMAGLAIGSFLLGKISDKYPDPVKLFAYVEIIIGLYALATPFLSSLLQQPYGALHEIFGNTWMFYLMLSYMAFAILIIPTGLIGGTFPIMNRIYAKKIDTIGKDVGIVYSIDTVFAALGALAAGFLLIPWIGINGTITSGALLNIGAGILLFTQTGNINKHIRNDNKDNTKEKKTASKQKISKLKSYTSYFKQNKATLDQISGIEKIILAAFFLSGFSALASQVVWTRFLSLAFGTSIYALSIITATFLIGLSLGSFVVSKYITGYKNLIPLFAYIECGIGLSSLLILMFFDKLDIPYLYLYHTMNSFYPFMVALFILIFVIMIIPTMLMGATMPVVSKIISSRIENIGMEIGTIYSLNTFGAIYGSFFASFTLIPTIGMTKTGALGGLINIFIALVIFVAYTRTNRAYKYKSRFYSIAGVAIIIFIYVTLSTINPLFAGVYYHGTQMDDLQSWKDAKDNIEVLYYDEGLYSSISVIQQEDYISLRTNGKTESSNVPVELVSEYMLAYIPLFANKDPQHTMMIGLGGGFTLHSIANFDEIKTIDVIEINPQVVEVTEKYFSQYINHVDEDPRVNMIIADARNHLLTEDKKYDVIISQPSNIWCWGEGGLFTQEMYEIVRSDLNEGGTFCQWMPLYEQNIEDFKTFLSTFQSVFPYSDLWIIGSDAVIIGSMDPIYYDYGNIRDHVYGNEMIYNDFNIMSDILATQGEHGLLNHMLIPYWISNDDIKSFSNGIINTDDKPILEFTTAKNAIYYQEHDNPLMILKQYIYNSRGDLTITPPMINTTTYSGNSILLDFMDAKVDMPDSSFEEIFAGFKVDHLQNQMHMEAVYKNDGMLLSIQAVPYDDFPVNTEKENIMNSMKYNSKYPIVDTQETAINGHWAYMTNSSYMNNDNHALIWYCDENDLLYTVSLDVKNYRQSASKSVLDTITCVHSHE